MALHDYECKAGHRTIDIHSFATDVLKSIVCKECGRVARMIFSTHTRMLEFENPEMGYGKPNPAFGGVVVRNWSHKQQLMKKFNVTESNDLVGGSRDPEMPPGYNGPGKPLTPQPREELGPHFWGNSLEEIEQKGEQYVRDANSGRNDWDGY